MSKQKATQKGPSKPSTESLERLKNQLEQAKLEGNTDLAKKIQAIIKRLDRK